jgi:hypothetical protein
MKSMKKSGMNSEIIGGEMQSLENFDGLNL